MHIYMIIGTHFFNKDTTNSKSKNYIRSPSFLQKYNKINKFNGKKTFLLQITKVKKSTSVGLTK